MTRDTAMTDIFTVPQLLGIPFEFVLFAVTLVGVAIFHHRTMRVALTGLTSIALYKIFFTGFKTGPGAVGFLLHLQQEWVILVNLLCLLTGFALLSRHFEKSRLPVVLPKFMPHDWKGAFLLLAMVWVLSSFLDNIAAALIGGAMAHQLFRARVHMAYLVALVAAANAGGAWSVLGDTTTTMMWIDGVSPLTVFKAIIASSIALCVFGIRAAILQQKHSPILNHSHEHTHIDPARIAIVALILILALATNLVVNLKFPTTADHFPFVGAAVWLAILISVILRRPDWEVLPETVKGSIFLLSLVLCASMMPVQRLPVASWPTALGLGFLSAIFDNIPLTALALKQGGYDWGLLSFSVGFGGSMVWFGSSAGVALSGLYPEAKSVLSWLRHSWLVALAFVIGFFVLLLVGRWNPTEPPPREQTTVALLLS
jgi:Na+/H+ antiporter NhaD/arsenite permease-like protein